jgi:hypothetical protein
MQMAEAGVEHTAKPAGNTAFSPKGGAKSGALSPALAALIQSWPKLPEHIKKTIMIIVEAAS